MSTEDLDSFENRHSTFYFDADPAPASSLLQGLRIRNRIRINFGSWLRIRVKSWVRIRIKVKSWIRTRIRNTALNTKKIILPIRIRQQDADPTGP
jgi:hypothetical protein